MIDVPRTYAYDQGMVMITDHRFDADSGATLDGEYRYDLWRRWAPDQGTVTWVMLNPSTADASLDDPTIRRCIGFSKGWGFGELIVVNQYALRATNPKDLLAHPDPRGPRNMEMVGAAIERSDLVVAAWGTFKVPGHTLMDLSIVGPFCLGHTKDGSPKHPLYLAADTKLERF